MRIYCFVIVFLFSTSVFAQTTSTIVTGRPGVFIGAETIGTKYFQIQSGLEQSTLKAGNSTSEIVLNNNVIRYGLNEKLELNANIDLIDLDSSDDRNSGNIQIGGRLNLIPKARKYTPKLSFQTRIQLTDSEGEQNKRLKLVSTLVGEFDLKNNGTLTGNLNFSNIDKLDYEFNFYNIAWSKNFDKRLSYFVEFYSIKSDSDWLKYWDVGFGYIVHKYLALDISVGQDLEDDFNSQFVATGFSWRKLNL